MPTYGPKLQALINGECIDPSAVASLTTGQLDAIEGLTDTEVEKLISARSKLGQMVSVWWI